MTSPTIGSILLGSREPAALRDWYRAAFDADDARDGMLDLGGVLLILDGRDDLADRTAEPARCMLNVHVPDARVAESRLVALGATWVRELEAMPFGLIGTVVDPDGNYVQIVEHTA